MRKQAWFQRWPNRNRAQDKQRNHDGWHRAGIVGRMTAWWQRRPPEKRRRGATEPAALKEAGPLRHGLW